MFLKHNVCSFVSLTSMAKKTRRVLTWRGWSFLHTPLAKVCTRENDKQPCIRETKYTRKKVLLGYVVSLWCNKRWVSFYFIGFGRFFFTPSPSHSARSGENSGSSEEFLKRIFMFALHILFRLDKYLCFMRCISSILITVFCRLLGAVMGNPRRLSFATSTSSRKSRKIVHAKR